MKIAYFDCIAGASGDMLLGALIDAGLSEHALKEQLAGLHLEGFTLECRRVSKNGFGATKVDVHISGDVPERRLNDIIALIQDSDLPPDLIDKALAIFRRLGEVEAEIHGVPLEKVHLHELGGMDTIVDVTGVLAGLRILAIERVYASPLPLGRGFVRGAHGPIPLPAPATMALLKDVPVTGSDLNMELVTPTGAVLLTSLAESFGPIPAMILSETGYGAGGRDLPVPNLLRVLIGEQASPAFATLETLAMLETNIDDLNPEIFDYVMSRLLEAGALDVFLTPIQMKKNRPATRLSVLCRPAESQALESILFAETSTLGIRRQSFERTCLPRSTVSVETPYGVVRVKLAYFGDRQVKSAPEYEDCRRLAAQHQVPLKEVYRAAELAALASGKP